jgi:hypothetical protein
MLCKVSQYRWRLVGLSLVVWAAVLRYCTTAHDAGRCTAGVVGGGSVAIRPKTD